MSGRRAMRNPRNAMRLLVLASLALLFARGVYAEDVALTFDDLPALSLTHSFAYWDTTTIVLLDGLRRNWLPATGFVNESKLEGDDKALRIALLAHWRDAGMDLGNHGYAHLSLNRTPLDAYIADVAQGGVETAKLLAKHGRALRWFRYPYLETGLTTDTRRAFESWLSVHGYRVAPVTMENSDWMFAIPYDDAVLHSDAAGAARIKKAYLDYTEKVVPWYRAAALQLLDRRPAFVFLLHATRLNADSIDALSAILKRNDLTPVSLDRAMADPAYAIADTYVGPDGDEWLSRWSLTLGKDLPWDSFPEPPADIAAEDNRLDPSP
jgi:peptidoglycan/xylan/chitin deacetylase (PgdA/CDA1 family)